MLEMGTEQRYDIYDLFLQFPDPLVPRRRRLEVTERMDRDGNVHHAARPSSSPRRCAQRWPRRACEAVAVCFLHAYRNSGARTRSRRAIVRAVFPDIAVSLSSRRGGGDVGIPALRHDLRERLRAAADGPLSRASWSASCGSGASAARCT